MNDTHVTFHGWVGGDVRHRLVLDTSGQQVSVVTLRVAVTPRLRRDTGWVDGETTWYSVTAWRTLAEHIRDSVHKGDPVIVHGRLRTETYVAAEGQSSVTLLVDASLVGHDLSRGRSQFLKPIRLERVPEATPTAQPVEPAA